MHRSKTDFSLPKLLLAIATSQRPISHRFTGRGANHIAGFLSAHSGKAGMCCDRARPWFSTKRSSTPHLQIVVGALVVLSIAAIDFGQPAIAAATTTFFDDFNRPDGPVDNGWLNTSGNADLPLVIRNQAVSNSLFDPITSTGGHYAGIYRPTDYSGSVTASADITQMNGYGGLLGRYDTSLSFKNDGALSDGYRLNFTRADQNYNDSAVSLFLNGTQLSSMASSFQFGSQIAVSATLSPDGSIVGAVNGGSDTFNFSFGATNLSSLSGTNFAIVQSGPDERSATLMYSTVDNVSISTTQPSLPPLPIPIAFETPFDALNGAGVDLHTEVGGLSIASAAGYDPPCGYSSGYVDTCHTANKAYYALDLYKANSTGTMNVIAASSGHLASGTGVVCDNGKPPCYAKVVIDNGPQNGSSQDFFTIYQEYQTFTDPNAEEEAQAALDNYGLTRAAVQNHILINSGQTIGEVLATGNSHLHFQVGYGCDASAIGCSKEKTATGGTSPVAQVQIGGTYLNQFKLTGFSSCEVVQTAQGFGVQSATCKPTACSVVNDPSEQSCSYPAVPTVVDNSYQFSETIIDPSQITFFDPAVAIGYDFNILSGPLFQSVLLPTVGDGLYDLYSCDGAFEGAVSGGVSYSFGANGSSCFDVLGIDEAALLDPTDPLAFDIGFTFTGSGPVQFDMTPITEQVPEPTSLTLFASGLLMVTLLRFLWPSRPVRSPSFLMISFRILNSSARWS